MKIPHERILQIESIAGTVLQDAYGNTSIYDIEAPVKLEKIISYFGLNLMVADFSREDLKDVAGIFLRQTKHIYIPEHESYQRNAFTIAHEIGHYVLHKDMPSEVFYRHQADLLRTANEDMKQAESEANWFAASLLMPIELIKKYKPLYASSPEQLSILFGVSKESMHWRLKNLSSLSLANE